MKLYVRNMVCNRCMTMIKKILESNNLKYSTVKLGEISLEEDISAKQHRKLSWLLKDYGFELADNNDTLLMEKIKESIRYFVIENRTPEVSLATHLALTVNQNFNFLESLFSEIKGISLEQYFIENKIKRIKYLLTNERLSLAQIAGNMHYEHVAEMIEQFREYTGLSPTRFKSLFRKSF